MARLPRSAPTLRDLANEPVSDDTMFDVPVMEPADVGSQSGRLNGRPSIAVSFAAVLAVLVVLLLILVAVLLSRGSGGATLSPTAPGQDAGPWNGTQFPAIGEREGCGV
jgi:hypothetical protein